MFVHIRTYELRSHKNYVDKFSIALYVKRNLALNVDQKVLDDPKMKEVVQDTRTIVTHFLLHSSQIVSIRVSLSCPFSIITASCGWVFFQPPPLLRIYFQIYLVNGLNFMLFFAENELDLNYQN